MVASPIEQINAIASLIVRIGPHTIGGDFTLNFLSPSISRKSMIIDEVKAATKLYPDINNIGVGIVPVATLPIKNAIVVPVATVILLTRNLSFKRTGGKEYRKNKV